MGLPKIKFEKEQKKATIEPVLQIKVGLKQEAKLDLGSQQASISVTLVAPGLSPQAVTALLNAVGDDGFVNINVMPREEPSGKGKDNDKRG